MLRQRLTVSLLALLSASSLQLACTSEASPLLTADAASTNDADTATDAGDEFTLLQLPVRVFLYSFEGGPAYNATMSLDDVANQFAGVNEIWAQAGVEWQVSSVEEILIPSSALPNVDALNTNVLLREALRDISPAPANETIWTAVFIRTMPISAAGLYVTPTNTGYVSELIPSGEAALPGILAHELGHSLMASGHVTGDATNLMQAGGEGADQSNLLYLSDEQIAEARQQALLGPR